VGEVLLRLLEERGVAAERLVLLASAGSAGRPLVFAGRELRLLDATPAALDGIDVAFFAATGAVSARLVPAALERGVRVVDKSATYRSDPAVPLVVPAVNGASLAGARLVASPNCTTIGIVHALEPLRRVAGLSSVTITTLQAASGAGRDGLDALECELRGDSPLDSPFVARLADDVVPLCGALDADGTSEEEHKLRAELRRILDLPALGVESTCIRVPVRVGHTASLRVTTERPLGLAEAHRALAAFAHVRLVEAPTPAEVAGTDEVLVGRLRLTDSGDVLLVQCADNLRRGAATNALECAEGLLAGTPASPR
jgi:aspartate-semialdehyde dehydrogenase